MGVDPVAANLGSALSWRVYRAFSDPHPRSDLMLEVAAIELLCQLSGKRPCTPEAGITNWLRQALDILYAEFRQPFSLTAIPQV